MTLKNYSQVCPIDPSNSTSTVQPDGTIATCPVTPKWVLNNDVQNFDINQALGFWTAAFTTIIFLYFSSKGIASILGMVKRA
jgi:hypothetical protein